MTDPVSLLSSKGHPDAKVQSFQLLLEQLLKLKGVLVKSRQTVLASKKKAVEMGEERHKKSSPPEQIGEVGGLRLDYKAN